MFECVPCPQGGTCIGGLGGPPMAAVGYYAMQLGTLFNSSSTGNTSSVLSFPKAGSVLFSDMASLSNSTPSSSSSSAFEFNPNYFYTDGNTTYVYLKCPIDISCQGVDRAADAGDLQCTQGYSGFVCNTCATGFYRLVDRCYSKISLSLSLSLISVSSGHNKNVSLKFGNSNR